jgi:hypothetical protein
VATRQKQKSQIKHHYGIRRISTIEFRAITFVAILILAGITIYLGIKDPVVWGFLGTALGLSMGQPMK